MALPYSKQLRPPSGSLDVISALGRMRNDIESIWHTVRATRRSIEDARDSMERADEVLARRLSERR